MGRTVKTSTDDMPQNPAVKCYEWKGGIPDGGHFSRWDSEAKARVNLEVGFKFVYLEERVCVTGFYESKKTPLYSNEIDPSFNSMKHSTLKVLGFENGDKKIFLEGTWNNIKVAAKGIGAKFSRTIYAMADGDCDDLKDGELFRMVLHGGGAYEWSDMNPADKAQGIVVGITEEKKKGNVRYKDPIWKPEAIDADTDAAAIKAEMKVSSFFEAREAYFNNPAEQEALPEETAEETAPTEDASEEDIEEEVPF